MSLEALVPRQRETPVPRPYAREGVDTSGVYDARATIPPDDYEGLRNIVAEEMQVPPEAIATSESEVGEKTRIYVGPLYPGIFKHAGALEHIYTDYPAGKIRRFDLVKGGKTARELLVAMRNAGIVVADMAAETMIEQRFQPEKGLEQMDLVRVTPRDLGLTKPSTTQEIYDRAKELGLELCPPEAGPRLRLAYSLQPKEEWLRMAMEEITDKEGGIPVVFTIEHVNMLGFNWASPTHRWTLDTTFVFRQPN